MLQIGSVVLPMIVLATWGFWVWHMEWARAVEHAETNVELVQQYAHRVIESQQSLLDEVAELIGDQDVTTLDRQELHERLARLVDRFAFTLSVGVVSPDGRLIVSSLTYPIDVSVEDREYFQVLREGGAGGPYLERVTLRPSDREALVVAVRGPGDGFNGILAASIRVEAFTNFFGQIARDERASASLMRQDGMLLVRHTPEAPATSLPADAPVLRAIRRGDRGTYEALAVTDNIERLYAFARVGNLPLFANFGAPRAAIVEAWMHDMGPVVALLALAAVLGLVGTMQTSHRLAAEQARQQAAVDRRLLEQAQKTAEMRQALLSEVHHRTKNNLQAVLSLIKLGGGHDRKIEQRVWAISQVHDLLYNAQDFRTIDLGQFLETVCANDAIVPPENGMAVHCDVDEVEVDINSAVPLALASVELITNAIKHAFPDGRRGTVRVTLRGSDGKARLVIEDDGIGISEETRRNSGLRLVRGFVNQADGALQVRANGGTRYVIEFPVIPIPNDENIREGQDQFAFDATREKLG
jgi:two-component sensor histidine kinase